MYIDLDTEVRTLGLLSVVYLWGCLGFRRFPSWSLRVNKDRIDLECVKMRSKIGSSVDSQSHIEIVNIEEDYPFFSTPISRKDKGKSISDEGKSTPAVNFIDLCYDDDDDDDFRVLMFQPSNTHFMKRRKTENGESSSSNTKNDVPSFACEICTDDKPANESFGIQNCSHSYCKDCTNNYVASKLQENITIIKCPVVQFCHLRCTISGEMPYGEGMIVRSQRFYCPFKDCSALLIDDTTEEVVRESECPNCNRMFCAQCKVPWHAGIGCTEFQQLNEGEREREDIMLMNIAQNKQWRRCPYCRMYVDKWTGCNYVTCRCGTTFHYSTGRGLPTNIRPRHMLLPTVVARPATKKSKFVLFMDEFRQKYREEHPNSSPAAASRAGHKKWKSMSISEKVSYVAMSTQKR